MKKINRLVLQSTLLMAIASSANAEIELNGFATFAAGKTLKKDQQVYGYDENLSYTQESLFAFQLSADLADGLSSTAQFISRGEKDFETQVEWAYLTYEIDKRTRLNFGRLRTPFYKYSDYLDVTYAYPWVRPPQAFYSLSFSVFDGVSLYRTDSFGDWDTTLQVMGGRQFSASRFGTAFSGPIEARNDLQRVWGISATISNDVYEFGINQSNASDMYVELAPATAIEAALSTPAIATLYPDAASDFAFDGDKGSFTSLNFKADYGVVYFLAEAGENSSEATFFGDSEQAYITFGHRISDTWEWHLTYEQKRSKAKAELYDPLLVMRAGTIAASDAVEQAQAEQAIDFIASQETDTTVITLGLNYNFHSNATFKLEYTDRENNAIVDLSGSAIPFASTMSPFTPGGGAEASLISLAVSLVF